MKTQFKRVCASCGGRVRSHHEVVKSTIPARDDRGRFLFRTETDKQTGQMVERQIMVQVEGRGLGHWTCANGCKPCKVRTTLVPVSARTAEVAN